MMRYIVIVVDTLNTTLGILAGSQKLIVQRGAYTTNKLIQSASQKTKSDFNNKCI